MGGCCYACLKYLVMLFNLVYMLLGLFLQGTMLWIYFDEAIIAPVAKDVEGYNWAIFVLMGIGTLMTIMGFMGCCGALQESPCMLAVFISLVFVLFAGQVAACAWIYANTDKFEDTIIESFKNSFQQHYQYHDMKTKAMDIMQKDLRCCGASGPKDWAGARTNTNTKDHQVNGPVEIGVAASPLGGVYEIPASCCNTQLKDTACDAIRNNIKLGSVLADNIYKEGCAQKVIGIIKEGNWITVTTLVAIALIEILAMIFSVCLCCTARRIDQYKA